MFNKSVSKSTILWYVGNNCINSADSWLSFFQERGTNKEIEEKLEEIMDYFNSTLCAFVVHDLNVLLETWLRDSQASFVKLPPM